MTTNLSHLDSFVVIALEYFVFDEARLSGRAGRNSNFRRQKCFTEPNYRSRIKFVQDASFVSMTTNLSHLDSYVVITLEYVVFDEARLSGRAGRNSNFRRQKCFAEPNYRSRIKFVRDASFVSMTTNLSHLNSFVVITLEYFVFDEARLTGRAGRNSNFRRQKCFAEPNYRSRIKFVRDDSFVSMTTNLSHLDSFVVIALEYFVFDEARLTGRAGRNSNLRRQKCFAEPNY